jgi:hypothetical protein
MNQIAWMMFVISSFCLDPAKNMTAMDNSCFCFADTL